MIFQQMKERWNRFREARARLKTENAALHSHHGHGRFFLLHIPTLATICAAIVEVYWAILFCIEATGSIDWNYETAAGTADREAAQAQITAAADNARATIDTLAASVDATPEQLNAAANDAQQAAQALAAAVSENGITPAYTQAYAELVAAVDAAQPADVAAAAEAARSAVDATATTAATNAPLLNPDIWNFAFSTHWPVFVGLVCATIPIVMLSMVWLPVQFAMRGAGRWRRGTVILCGLLANVLVIVSGTVVMNYNRQDQVREALVVEQTADANRVMLAASVEDLRAELDTLMNHRSTYVATAASVGATAYERDYVAQARATNDPRLPLLERALGSARRADELRQQIQAARAAVATAAPAAASASNVEDTVGRELNTFAQYVEVWRPPFVAVICTLIGIFGAWWVLALIQGINPKDVLRSGWADEGHRIEDLREQEPVAAQPMRPTREVVTDAETGEELIRITPKPHWRKQKGRKQKVEVAPDVLPDETGVAYDGGGRIGSAAESAIQADEERDDTEAKHEEEGASNDGDNGASRRPEGRADQDSEAAHDAESLQDGEPVDVVQSEPPEETLTEEELKAIAALDAAVDTADAEPQREPSSGDDGESEQGDLQQRDEPETNEARMLPNVAAE